MVDFNRREFLSFMAYSAAAILPLAGYENGLAEGGAVAKKRPSASTWPKTKNTKKP